MLKGHAPEIIPSSPPTRRGREHPLLTVWASLKPLEAETFSSLARTHLKPFQASILIKAWGMVKDSEIKQMMNHLPRFKIQVPDYIRKAFKWTTRKKDLLNKLERREKRTSLSIIALSSRNSWLRIIIRSKISTAHRNTKARWCWMSSTITQLETPKFHPSPSRNWSSKTWSQSTLKTSQSRYPPFWPNLC